MKKSAPLVPAYRSIVSSAFISTARRRPKVRWAALLALASLVGGLALCPSVLGGTDKNQGDVIRRANAAYYGLKGKGMQNCRCQVTPDWDAIFTALNTGTPAQSQVLQLLKKTRLQVAIGPTGASTFSHEADYVPPDEQIAGRIRSVTQGLDQMITGFFNIWSPLTFDSPLPDPDSEFQLEDVDAQYRVTFEQGTAHVVTTMNHDFAMTETVFKSPQMAFDIHPQWERVKGVYILSAFSITFGPDSASAQKLAGNITYQVVEGFEFPHTVALTVPTPTQSSLAIQFTFTDCQVTKQ